MFAGFLGLQREGKFSRFAGGQGPDFIHDGGTSRMAETPGEVSLHYDLTCGTASRVTYTEGQVGRRSDEDTLRGKHPELKFGLGHSRSCPGLGGK
jgi:hypothetical protein